MKTFLLSLLILVASSLSAQLTSSLNACYALNNDASEPISGLSGTLGAVTATVDRNNNPSSAISFTGAPGSNITLPDDTRLKPQELTFSAWVKAVNTGGSQYIVFTKNTASGNFEAYFMVFNGSGYFVAGKGNNGVVANVSTTTTVSSNTWHHVAFSFDNANVKIYLDGALEATVASTLVVGYETGKKILLGGSGESFNLPFNGCIDNVRFYNRVLSASEVGQLYSQDPACVATNTNVTTSIGGAAVEQSDLVLYPNPSNGKVTLKSELKESFHFDLIDLTGRVLFSDHVKAQDIKELDLIDLPAGIYFIKALREGRTQTYKLVRE